LVKQREAREAFATGHSVPEIVVVEDIPSTPLPPASSRDITSAIRRHSAGTTTTSWTEPETPTRRDEQFELADLQLAPTISGAGAGPSSSGGLRRDRRLSDMSAVSADLGLRRELSMFRDSQYLPEDFDQDVLASVQNSDWGAMMIEAEEEEQNQKE